MMIKKIIIIFLAAISFFSYNCLGAENKTDPFDSLLPEKEDGQTTLSSGTKVSTPPPVIVEGAIWGTDSPQAIIDGDVYKVGDKLKSLDAKVYKIEKNSVFIFYEGRLHEMKVTGKKEAQ
jgi:type II secretory pathway component PulC